MTPYLFLQPLQLATSNFVHNLGLVGTSLPKTTFRTEIGGFLAIGEHTKSCDPVHILQPLKLATENLVHNMCSGLPCQTQVLGPK